MKLYAKIFASIAGLCFLVSLNAGAQKPANWTKDQLMEPVTLASMITNNKPLPVIISVGPGAIIKNSVDVGMMNDSANIDKLLASLTNLPKDTAIVIYCGCCPFEHCPNVRPAIEVLKRLQFTNYKLLDLSTNIKTDWIDKKYPTIK